MGMRQMWGVGHPAMSPIADHDYEFIRRLVHDESGINLGEGKKELVSARLGSRIAHLGLKDFHAYCLLLRSQEGRGELQRLVDLIATKHTNFFREEDHFGFLAGRVVGEWRNSGEATREGCFRVWSAAVATGEEAYSIAIALAHAFADAPSLRWKIEASDISDRALEKAKRGVYHGEAMLPIREDWIRHYFQYGVGEWEGYYRVRPEIRANVSFHHLNLLQDSYPFAGRFHAIFCRNVMIYFDRPTQEFLLSRLHDRLLPGGYLFVGHSEALNGVRHPLHPVLSSIFQRGPSSS